MTEEGASGPNLEFTLSAAIEFEVDDVAVTSVDMDGIDGNSDSAGAIVTGTTADFRSGAKCRVRWLVMIHGPI